MVFLYTRLMEHDVAGCGIPAAFLATISETHRSPPRWFNWLRENYLIPISPKLIIDCYGTEMAAIESSIEKLQIYLCHWHVLRSMWTQVNAKIKAPTFPERQSAMQVRRFVVQDFMALIYSKSVEELGQVRSEYHDRYRQHEEWLRYFEAHWPKHAERLWSCNRDVSVDFQHIC